MANILSTIGVPDILENAQKVALSRTFAIVSVFLMIVLRFIAYSTCRTASQAGRLGCCCDSARASFGTSHESANLNRLSGQMKRLTSYFCEMLEKQIEPDSTTYVFLLKGLCQENEFETALEVFKRSFEQDEEIAQTLLGKFILYLCKEGTKWINSHVQGFLECL